MQVDQLKTRPDTGPIGSRLRVDRGSTLIGHIELCVWAGAVYKVAWVLAVLLVGGGSIGGGQ